MWKLLQTQDSPKTVTLLYIITETVRFYNDIRSSRRQVPREIEPYIKDFPAWISDILESERDAQNSD